jgi:Na+/proline symporter
VVDLEILVTALDWAVLVSTITLIVLYGVSKGSTVSSSRGYLRGEDLRWPTIGLSIMATQASAITFLSVPGQAFEDGMRFVQFYFGLPIAMVLISVFFVPIYHRLQVYTAYEYLEQRFDVRVRVLTSVLFMIGRGLAAGISLYAPGIILSSAMGWSLHTMNVLLGSVVILYTVTGGAKAVGHTNRQQMVVILAGILLAAVVIARWLPVSVGEATTLAGALGRMNVVDFRFDPSTRYTFWSGITGGLFLSLSYFGTDQSQVQRYLGGASMAESRLGLLFNGILKIPMQFLILYIGLLVFVFYLFEKPPVFFNAPTLEAVRHSQHAGELLALEARWDAAFLQRKASAEQLVASDTQQTREALQQAEAQMVALRTEAKELVKRAVPDAELKDSDYIFVSFVLRYMPSGMVGMLLAVILMASMSTTASELSALGSTSVVDLYKRLWRPDLDERGTMRVSKLFVVLWGLVALAFATFASLLDNLIQAVNILGSIFYGVILGIFLVGFSLPHVRATPVLLGAIVAQATVIALYLTTDIGFLWFNVIGCSLVFGLALGTQAMAGAPPEPAGGESP